MIRVHRCGEVVKETVQIFIIYISYRNECLKIIIFIFFTLTVLFTLINFSGSINKNIITVITFVNCVAGLLGIFYVAYNYATIYLSKDIKTVIIIVIFFSVIVLLYMFTLSNPIECSGQPLHTPAPNNSITVTYTTTLEEFQRVIRNIPIPVLQSITVAGATLKGASTGWTNTSGSLPKKAIASLLGAISFGTGMLATNALGTVLSNSSSSTPQVITEPSSVSASIYAVNNNSGASGSGTTGTSS